MLKQKTRTIQTIGQTVGRKLIWRDDHKQNGLTKALKGSFPKQIMRAPSEARVTGCSTTLSIEIQNSFCHICSPSMGQPDSQKRSHGCCNSKNPWRKARVSRLVPMLRWATSIEKQKRATEQANGFPACIFAEYPWIVRHRLLMMHRRQRELLSDAVLGLDPSDLELCMSQLHHIPGMAEWHCWRKAYEPLVKADARFSSGIQSAGLPLNLKL